jgi:steroid delta-isomerase-like uncharacterized protein
MENETTYKAFAGARLIAGGTLRDVLPVLKRRFDEDRSDLVLVFDLDTGRQVDFDLRGTLDEVLEREAQRDRRGPGRPKLGVTSREVSLLPRHWEWLERQSSGISGSLRRLVEQALKVHPGKERARRIRDALSQFLSAMAGDRPNYEEATRALFRGDTEQLEALVQRWPKDVREHAIEQAREAARADAEPLVHSANETVVDELYRLVWNQGDLRAIDRLVAPRYAIHSDPGDPWEGKTLDREGYEERLSYSRTAFPDLSFTIHELVAAGNRVAVRWSAEGTHTGDLRDLPATGKRLGFSGQTIYELDAGKVVGHWQVVDRLGFLEQLRRAQGGRA